ncbi:mannitol-1-phosphate 5-dehydrogenase, partial [Escherichia coli FRIK523]
STPCADA